ncbi:MAG TPA: chemotaxis protein CheW [Gemmataceae bacterium]|nr:chemotaxis protein CheW [Gemmataceae bacterium]
MHPATALTRKSATPSPEGARTFCTFRLGQSLFGIDIGLVKEVTTLTPLTPIPHAPAAAAGYVNLRGHVHLVLDLKRLLGLGATQPGPESLLVVFKPALGDPFGVLADRVGDIVSLRQDQIEESGSAEATAPHGGLVSGLGKLDGELLVLLDARKFLPAPRQAPPAATP